MDALEEKSVSRRSFLQLSAAGIAAAMIPKRLESLLFVLKEGYPIGKDISVEAESVAVSEAIFDPDSRDLIFKVRPGDWGELAKIWKKFFEEYYWPHKPRAALLIRPKKLYEYSDTGQPTREWYLAQVYDTEGTPRLFLSHRDGNFYPEEVALGNLAPQYLNIYPEGFLVGFCSYEPTLPGTYSAKSYQYFSLCPSFGGNASSQSVFMQNYEVVSGGKFSKVWFKRLNKEKGVSRFLLQPSFTLSGTVTGLLGQEMSTKITPQDRELLNASYVMAIITNKGRDVEIERIPLFSREQGDNLLLSAYVIWRNGETTCLYESVDKQKTAFLFKNLREPNVALASLTSRIQHLAPLNIDNQIGETVSEEVEIKAFLLHAQEKLTGETGGFKITHHLCILRKQENEPMKTFWFPVPTDDRFFLVSSDPTTKLLINSEKVDNGFVFDFSTNSGLYKGSLGRFTGETFYFEISKPKRVTSTDREA